MSKNMENHRSIRRYTEEKISSSLLEEVIRSAQMASTSTHMQPYSVIVVEEEKKRKTLRQLTGDQRWVEEAPLFLVFLVDLHRIQGILERRGVSFGAGYVESLLAASVDTALFAQNVLLGFEARGFGGVFIGGIRNEPAQVSSLLDLPDQCFAIFGLCIGRPAQDPEKKPRLPLELVLMRESYQPVDLAKLEAYDQEVSTYYERRSKGRDLRSYSDNMAEKFERELRPWMESFLKEKGLLKA